MREIVSKIYKYNELSDNAKKKARQDFATIHGYLHEDEAFASMKALAKHFNVEIADYDIDFFGYFGSHSSMSFALPNWDDEWLHKEEIKELLNQLGEYDPETLKGTGECKLTGVCHDEDAIEGFRKEFHYGKGHNIVAMMKAAFKSWLTACQNDCHEFYGDLSEYGDESFADYAEANDFEYYEDGTFYSKPKE